jgi:hypothetical protein
MQLRVDVIDTNEVVLDQNLAFFWCRNWQVRLILQHFDAACLFDKDTAHGFGDRGRHLAGEVVVELSETKSGLESRGQEPSSVSSRHADTLQCQKERVGRF